VSQDSNPKTLKELEEEAKKAEEEEKKENEAIIEGIAKYVKNKKKLDKLLDYCLFLTSRYYLCIEDLVAFSIGRTVVTGTVVDILKHGSRIAIDTGGEIAFVNLTRVTWFKVLERGSISKELFGDA